MKPEIQKLVSSNRGANLSSAEKANIKEIKGVLTDILETDTINTYFKIILNYLEAKREKNMLISDVAKSSGLPETTIKRFENLQSIPKILTLLKILESVGLSLTTMDL